MALLFTATNATVSAGNSTTWTKMGQTVTVRSPLPSATVGESETAWVTQPNGDMRLVPTLAELGIYRA